MTRSWGRTGASPHAASTTVTLARPADAAPARRAHRATPPRAVAEPRRPRPRAGRARHRRGGLERRHGLETPRERQGESPETPAHGERIAAGGAGRAAR